MSFGITTFAQSPFASLGGNAYNQSVSESVALADAQAVAIVKALDVAESIAAVDTPTALQNLGVAVNETTNLVDSIVGGLLSTATQDETVAAADSLIQEYGTFLTVSDSMAVVDAYTLTNNIFNVAVAEATTPSDTDSSTGLILIEEVDEVMSVAETQAVTQALAAAVAESIASLDAYTETRDLVASIAESSAIGLFIGAGYNGNVDVSESVATADAFTGQRVFSYFISESVAPADAQVGIINFVTSSVAESLAAADNITFTVDTRALPTGVLITLSVNNVNVWGNINDDSNPNWVIIQD
jgi:hypothetical protein